MFVGRILDNGNYAFESRDGKIIEEVPMMTKRGISVSYKFEGFSVIIPKYMIKNLSAVYRKSEGLIMDDLYLYVLKTIGV